MENLENLFKITVESQYVEDFKLDFFNGKNKHGYTGYVCTVFEVDKQAKDLVLNVRFIKFADIEEFLRNYELLSGTKLKDKIFVKKG